MVKVLIDLDKEEHEALLEKKETLTWKEFLMCQKDVFDAKKAMGNVEKRTQLERLMDKVNDSGNKTELIKKLGFITSSEMKESMESVVSSHTQEDLKLRHRVKDLEEQLEVFSDRFDKINDRLDNNLDYHNSLDGIFQSYREAITDIRENKEDKPNTLGCRNKNVNHVGGHRQVT